MGVDRVWTVDATVRSWLGQVRALRAERFDLVIDLQGLFRSGVLGWLSGGPMRIGFANGREGSPWFYTHRVSVPSLEMHAVDRYLLVAAALGAPPKRTPQFRFKMLDADMAVVRDVFHRRGISVDKPWVAMSVSARWPTKRWPLSSFAAVADQLTKEGSGPIVVIGSHAEQGEVNQLKAIATSSLIDLSGGVPLGCLPALLSRSALLITNDSGPMHVAAAVGTPVVALFGPTSERRTGPYGLNHRVLTGDVPCRPCFSRVCRHSPVMECLHLITPDDVVAASRHMLSQQVTSR
jgi:lipopolysaccharide heptosyltransferase II